MIPITKATLPPYADVEPLIRKTYESGIITNSTTVRAFEAKVAQYVGVKHVVSAPSCSVALAVLMSTLPQGSEVIMPAFTFSATYQALLWNGLSAKLVDCNESCNIDASLVERAITPKTSAILAVHMYGTATDLERLEEISARRGIPLFFDAAHGFGASYKGRKLGGFGTAEVFSCGPTKTLPIGEGGIITTNDDTLAQRVRSAVNHGQPANSLDSVVKSLNGRLEEINAAIGLRVIDDVAHWVGRRQELAARYRNGLKGIQGFSYPAVPTDVVSTYKDFCVFVDKAQFGMDRDQLMKELELAGIQTKRYFYPTINNLTVSKNTFAGEHYPNSETKAAHVVALPMYSHMPFEDVDKVCAAVVAVHQAALKKNG